MTTACFNGDHAGVEAALQDGASVSTPGSTLHGSCVPPLAAALLRDRSSIVQYLIGQGADVNGPRVVMSAVNSKLELLEAVLAAGGVPRRCSETGEYPVFAVLRGYTALDKLQRLLACPELDLECTKDGNSLEELAEWECGPDAVELIASEVSSVVVAAPDVVSNPVADNLPHPLTHTHTDMHTLALSRVPVPVRDTHLLQLAVVRVGCSERAVGGGAVCVPPGALPCS